MHVKQEKWLIAVSGGPDSMALVHLMKTKGLDIRVAHVNYHQRPESDQEELMVKDYCIQHGLSFYRKDFTTEDNGNFQALARNFRYDFFAELILQHELNGVMVGHHYDDHIETYLMQKERGHQTEVLGLATHVQIKGVDVVRPLLKYTKQQLIKICEEHEVPYSIDASNENPKYTRNRIRLEPKNYIAIEQAMKADKMKYDNHKETVLMALESLSAVKIDITDYLRLDRLVRIDYLRERLKREGVAVFRLSKKYFEELDRQIQGGKAYVEFDSINLYVDAVSMVFLKPRPFEFKLNEVEYLETPYFILDKQGLTRQGLTLSPADFPITIRNFRQGDVIEMRYGRKKVNRYLIDNKIPRYLRDSWIVIENAMKECIFVVGMGCDVHHYANNASVFVIELNLL